MSAATGHSSSMAMCAAIRRRLSVGVWFRQLEARHSRVGSSFGSGASCFGRMSSGTLRKLTRIRVHVDDLPRIESTRMSSIARCFAAARCFFFHRSSPASAAFLSGELATVISGIFVRGALARDGATRIPSPSIFLKCGGHGASPSPAALSRSARSSSFSNEPAKSSIASFGSPISAKRFGTVSTVKSSGLQSGTSSQRNGVDTRASGSGRMEYAEQVVRSLAF